MYIDSSVFTALIVSMLCFFTLNFVFLYLLYLKNKEQNALKNEFTHLKNNLEDEARIKIQASTQIAQEAIKDSKLSNEQIRKKLIEAIDQLVNEGKSSYQKLLEGYAQEYQGKLDEFTSTINQKVHSAVDQISESVKKTTLDLNQTLEIEGKNESEQIKKEISQFIEAEKRRLKPIIERKVVEVVKEVCNKNISPEENNNYIEEAFQKFLIIQSEEKSHTK